MKDRLYVYVALCEVLKSHEDSYAYLSNMSTECMKLSKMSLREPFLEADFLHQVEKVAGEEGTVLCSKLMDGLDDESLLQALQQKAIEGRCSVCRESTYEDTQRVLLCDGCNGELHMACVGLQTVIIICLRYTLNMIPRSPKGPERRVVLQGMSR